MSWLSKILKSDTGKQVQRDTREVLQSSVTPLVMQKIVEFKDNFITRLVDRGVPMDVALLCERIVSEMIDSILFNK